MEDHDLGAIDEHRELRRTLDDQAAKALIEVREGCGRRGAGGGVLI
jgi:hypothetical protein